MLNILLWLKNPRTGQNASTLNQSILTMIAWGRYCYSNNSVDKEVKWRKIEQLFGTYIKDEIPMAPESVFSPITLCMLWQLLSTGCKVIAKPYVSHDHLLS